MSGCLLRLVHVLKRTNIAGFDTDADDVVEIVFRDGVAEPRVAMTFRTCWSISSHMRWRMLGFAGSGRPMSVRNPPEISIGLLNVNCMQYLLHYRLRRINLHCIFATQTNASSL